MDWDEWLDQLEALDVLSREPRLGPERTPEYWKARVRRIEYLRARIADGSYHVPAVLVAEGILLGRPKWGEAFIDEHGRRLDECGGSAGS